MKKLLLLFSFFAIAQLSNAQCTVDPTITVPGIYPENGTVANGVVYMPNGTEASFYSEVVQIKAPADTVIDTMGFQLTATIDSIELVKISGLPASLSIACNVGNCVYIGGDNGCAVVSGTPTTADVGTHYATIKIYGYVTIPGIGQTGDTLDTDLEIIIDPQMGIEKYVATYSLKTVPNPMTNAGAVSFQALSAENFEFELLDITGRVMQRTSGRTKIGENKIAIERNGWPNGLYFYSLKINGEVLTRKIVLTQ